MADVRHTVNARIKGGGKEITHSFSVTLESFACCGLVLSLQKNILEGEETRLYFIALQKCRVLHCTCSVPSAQAAVWK